MPTFGLASTVCRFVALRDLPPDWNIRDHFHNSIGKLASDHSCKASAATPIPHYEDSSRPTTRTSQSTILTITGTNSRIDTLLKKLGARDVYTGTSARLEVDEQFLGLFKIAESLNSDCDFYFVHGLGGHALSSWASELNTEDMGPDSVKIWPRDFLKRSLELNQIYSTIYTLGYNANVFRGSNVAAHLDSMSANLISHLCGTRALNAANAKRPMYFICHSLGGLVVAMALISLLQQEREGSRFASLDPNSRWLFVEPHTGECLVQGIVFLATPFQGSLRADQLSPFIEVLKKAYPRPTNSGLVGMLHSADSGQELYHLSGELNQIIQRYDIPVLVGYETQPRQVMGIGKRPIVDYNSARGAFTDSIPIALHGDHGESVKFDSKTGVYTNLTNRIIDMVRGRRQPANETENHDQFMPELPNFTRARGNILPSMSNRRSTEPATSMSSAHGNAMNLTINIGSDTGSRRTFDIQHGLRNLNLEGHNQGHLSNDLSVRTRQTRSPLTKYPTYPSGIHHQQLVNENYDYRDLMYWDTVFLVDDTDSMFNEPAEKKYKDVVDAPTRWAVLKQSLFSLVPVAKEYDDDGIDLFFLKSWDVERSNVDDLDIVEELLNEVELRYLTNKNGGGTNFEEPLKRIIQPRLDEYYEYSSFEAAGQNPDPPKPLNLIVITDGAASDTKPVEKYLVEVTTTLDKYRAPPNQIGIQFVQIGDDDDAAKWLKKLDNDDGKTVFAGQSSAQGIRDIVDTVPYTHPEHGGNSEREFSEFLIYKILFGAVRKEIDRSRSNRALGGR